ncbi:hypothetical protein BS50DRAFT_568569 [Corynespora cassiicola Philippines]|uniref:Uncharacterized protein n=1 Tax=Corynespora cassiicola Philippines TaxID=1448308 RepID=A0A2T2P5I0_CORCC|nr:hypothetical protein BS50DRAFT_568569 [Corynespora cassiicola Philippines]
MAIQVASITTLHNSAKGTVAYWQAVSTVVRAVSTLDIVASTLILLCLWILKQRSWYILLITLAASIISTYVFFDPRIMSVPDRLFEGPRQLNFTNKNTNPYSLCSVKLSGDSPRWHRMSTAWVFYLCVLILVFLIVDHIFSLRLPRAKDRPYFLSYSKFQRSLDRFVVQLRKRGKSVLSNAGRRRAYKLAYHFTLMGVIIACFYALGETYSGLNIYFQDTVETQDWSFGQVVSVAIWIPVVVDWLQLTFRGMESGSEYRIPHPYQVKRIDPSTSRPTTTLDFDSTTLERRNSIGLEEGAFVASTRRFATAEF